MEKPTSGTGQVPTDQADKDLIKAATEAIARNYTPERHTVGAAVLCGSGRIYAGVNFESCAYGPCAEFVAVGAAISQGERVFERIVAVRGPNHGHEVLAPCGNCRQMLLDYAPECLVLMPGKPDIRKIRARDLLPAPYSHFD